MRYTSAHRAARVRFNEDHRKAASDCGL
eukprot:gene2271-biopygen19970